MPAHSRRLPLTHHGRAFNFGEFADGKAQQPLPSDLVPDEPQINAFADSCHDLCQKLLYLLGLGLGVSHPLFSSSDPINSLVNFLGRRLLLFSA
jgi:hypothetical protein